MNFIVFLLLFISANTYHVDIIPGHSYYDMFFVQPNNTINIYYIKNTNVSVTITGNGYLNSTNVDKLYLYRSQNCDKNIKQYDIIVVNHKIEIASFYYYYNEYPIPNTIYTTEKFNKTIVKNNIINNVVKEYKTDLINVLNDLVTFLFPMLVILGFSVIITLVGCMIIHLKKREHIYLNY